MSNKNENLINNILLVNRFARTKLNLFMFMIPLVGVISYLWFFKSFFKNFSNRIFLWKYWRKSCFLTIGIFVVNFLLLFFILLIIFLFFISKNDNFDYKNFIDIILLTIISFMIFHYFYQTIITFVLKNNIKKYYYKFMLNNENINIDYNKYNDEIYFDTKKILFNYKNNIKNTNNSDFIWEFGIEIPINEQSLRENFIENNLKKQNNWMLVKLHRLFWISVSNSFYAWFLFLLNSLNPLLNNKKIFAIGIICSIKDFLFFILYPLGLYLIINFLIPNVNLEDFSIIYHIYWVYILVSLVLFFLLSWFITFIIKTKLINDKLLSNNKTTN